MAVKGIGRVETCIFHPDRSASARCAVCHRPVCSDCVVSTADGKFCTRDCAAKMADFRKSRKRTKTGPGVVSRLVKAVVWVVVIVVVLGAVNRFVFKNRMPVLGTLLNKIPYLGARAQ